MNPELKQIILAVQGGDESACTELYNETIRYACNLAEQFLDNWHDIQDVLQESYISAFRSIHTFDVDKDFKPWLKTIVRRKCINLLKKHTDIPVDLLTLGAVLDEGACIPGYSQEREDNRRELVEIISRLPAAQRTAIILFYFHEMRIADIARQAKVSESTIKSNLFHARKKIRAMAMESRFHETPAPLHCLGGFVYCFSRRLLLSVPSS